MGWCISPRGVPCTKYPVRSALSLYLNETESAASISNVLSIRSKVWWEDGERRMEDGR